MQDAQIGNIQNPYALDQDLCDLGLFQLGDF